MSFAKGMEFLGLGCWSGLWNAEGASANVSRCLRGRRIGRRRRRGAEKAVAPVRVRASAPKRFQRWQTNRLFPGLVRAARLLRAFLIFRFFLRPLQSLRTDLFLARLTLDRRLLLQPSLGFFSVSCPSQQRPLFRPHFFTCTAVPAACRASPFFPSTVGHSFAPVLSTRFPMQRSQYVVTTEMSASDVELTAHVAL